MNFLPEKIEPKLTPMMEQWMAAKRQHPDAVLLFRMGDFYELFGDDAVLSAPILEMALTSRDKDKSGLKMAGFPHHCAPSYINKLVEQGLKVAICEQLEDPKATKGIVKRGVTEVVSPGTLIEDEATAATNAHSFLVSFVNQQSQWSLCALDLSTATFMVTSTKDPSKISDEIGRLNPKEIVVLNGDGAVLSVLEALQKNYSSARFRIEKKNRFSHDTNALGDNLERQAQSLLRSYISELRGEMPGHIGQAVRYSIDDQLLMDESTRENLDLMPKKKGQKQNLYSVLNHAKTAMAKRLLAKELIAPSTSLSAIIKRQDQVAEFLSDTKLRDGVREYLSGCYDLSKLTALASSNKIGPRGLARLRDCLAIVESIKQPIINSSVNAIKDLVCMLPDLTEIRAELDRSLLETPPLNLKDGEIFKPGFDESLDELQELNTNGQNLLLGIEQKERAETGISSLKIKYTRVFGYYIEITKSNLDKVPNHYQRKQTIANGERYITTELNELEIKLNSAKEQMATREYELFENLRLKVAYHAPLLIIVGQIISEIDLIAGFAEAAAISNWKRPKLLAKEEQRISVIGGRHPIVEAICRQNGALFVPNDLELDNKKCSLALITGPNMAGKSTIMRQMALIQVMAQLGSFVPADSATLSICDHIFARVGASDDLSSGRSTFMVEMTETSHILHHASQYSLILLDEIGRGTSTYDGMSIAQAVAEYIHDHLKTRTLFATHYHELTELEKKLATFKNFHVEVEEKNGGVRFLYTIAEGPALESFGIQVAKLAGLPQQVVERAREILEKLESEEAPSVPILSKPLPSIGLPQPDLFGAGQKLGMLPEMERLAGLDINRITPVQALVKLQGLQTSVRQAIKSY